MEGQWYMCLPWINSETLRPEPSSSLFTAPAHSLRASRHISTEKSERDTNVHIQASKERKSSYHRAQACHDMANEKREREAKERPQGGCRKHAL